MATGRLWSPAFLDRRGSSRTEMVAVQEKPLAEERTLLKNTVTWFFLTLKIGGGGVIEEILWIGEKLVINMLM